MNIAKLKEEMDKLDQLRVDRSLLMQKQAKEIGYLDNAINLQFTKVSSLISLMDSL